ncbi:hypothetical protein Sspor_16700 [Streptomyces spororaveus]|uniref:Uncharacterized protein n=1 Tax=Streptomyces spororaveus TaxID=284039 RepID=A0ABQ3T6T5_9ACTN|nr:hypothetical protein Sspor_16700 [Streptomyces spororaveus]
MQALGCSAARPKPATGNARHALTAATARKAGHVEGHEASVTSPEGTRPAAQCGIQ